MAAALAHERAGRLAEAEALYRNIVAAVPNFHAAWHALGLLAVNSGRLPLALQCLEKAVAIEDRNGLYLRNITELYRRAGQMDRAITTGKRAASLVPDDPAAHYNLGLALADAGHHDQAANHYRIALLLQPEHVQAWNNLGSALERQGDRDAAADAYSRALALNPDHAEAHNNLGALQCEQGQLDEARSNFEAAIQNRPDFVEAHHNLSTLKTYRPHDPHLAQLRQLNVRREQLPVPARIRLAFSLGKALDDCDDHDNAFAHYAEGNRLQHTLMPVDEARADELFAQIMQTFNRDFFAARKNWQGAQDDTRRPIFIIGMPRSGTTLLEQILCSHPDVHGAGELPDLHDVITASTGQRPFGAGAQALDETGLRRLGQDYLNRVWSHAPASPCITDKMPANFLYLGLIHLALPNARIIHARRDPMDSCLSCFTHLFRTGMEFTYDLDSLGRYYARYHRLMEHWRQVLPPGAFLDVDYETLVDATAAEARRLLDFAGLHWDDNCLQFHRNPRPVHTASIAQVRQPVYRGSVGRWLRFSRHLQPLYKQVKNLRPPGAPEPDFPIESDANPSLQFDPEQLLQQAARQQQIGNLPETERLLHTLLRIQPDHARALHLLGIVYYQSGQPQRALDLLAQAITHAPDCALFHSNRGEMCRQQGLLDDAIRHGEKALASDPDLVSARSNLGIAWYDKGDLERAETCHQRALERQPDLLQSLNNMGSIQRARGDLTTAANWYRRALAVKPDFPEALSNLGAVLVEDDQAEAALTPLLQALRLRPDYPEALCNLGLARLRQERNSPAIGLFQQALQRWPDYPEALVGLARALHAEDRPEQVETLLQTALAKAPHKAEAWCHLGTVLMEQGRSSEAEHAFTMSLERDPALVDALVGLGNLRLEQGLIEESEILLRQAIDRDPAHVGARFHLIQARKVKPGDTDLAALEAILPDAEGFGSEKRISLHYALGKAYDDLRQPDDAFPHFLAGAKLKRAKLRYNPSIEANRADRIIAMVDKALLERLRGNGDQASGDPSEQPVFVLGMPRSGTTLTEQIIASHPQVHGAGELRDLMQVLQQTPTGQPQAYPDNLEQMTPALLSRLGCEYVERLRQHAPEARRITDKMPGNYLALGIIPLLLPNARIIHVQRNPVDTCLSCFTRLFNRHQDATYDLAELGRHYVHYARLMEHWRRVMPANSFLDVQYEDIVADMETQARRLIAWVGLEWNDACLDFHKNTRRVRTASLAQVRQPIYTGSVERWRAYEHHLGPLLEALGEYGPGGNTALSPER